MHTRVRDKKLLKDRQCENVPLCGDALGCFANQTAPEFIPGSRMLFYMGKNTLFFFYCTFASELVHYLIYVPMKSLLCAALWLLPALCGSPAVAQPGYEVTRNMPVFFEQMKQQLTYPLAWGKAPQTDFNAWRAEARSTVLECMQLLPPAAADYDMRILAREQREGYGALKISFNISQWCNVPAYLLVPEGKGPFPAIVMLHDHGAHFTIGKEKMVRPFEAGQEVLDDAAAWVVRCYDGQYVGDYFAAHGYVVLAVDALLWGDRGRKEGADYDSQQALASNFLQMGCSWGAFIAADDVRSAEFVASLPFVDKSRVGCLGFSMGAHRAWMLSTLTDCVQAAASICWMNTTGHLMTLANNQNKGGSAFSMIIPGLRRYLDYPHVASIACPKPSLFFNGTRDKLFPVEGVREAYAVLEDVYRSQGVSDRLATRLWDEQHFFSKAMQEETLRFFDHWFLLDSSLKKSH